MASWSVIDLLGHLLKHDVKAEFSQLELIYLNLRSSLVSTSSSKSGFNIEKTRFNLQVPATLIMSIDLHWTPLKQYSAKAHTSMLRLSHYSLIKQSIGTRVCSGLMAISFAP